MGATAINALGGGGTHTAWFGGCVGATAGPGRHMHARVPQMMMQQPQGHMAMPQMMHHGTPPARTDQHPTQPSTQPRTLEQHMPGRTTCRVRCRGGRRPSCKVQLLSLQIPGTGARPFHPHTLRMHAP